MGVEVEVLVVEIWKNEIALDTLYNLRMDSNQYTAYVPWDSTGYCTYRKYITTNITSLSSASSFMA